MKKKTLMLLNDLNRAIIQFRGLYSCWSGIHGISYNELLVLYTIREKGYCTQKQICDSYLLPRQTINHVIRGLRDREILLYSRELSRGREKAFVLSEKGRRYAAPFLESLNGAEEKAVELFGEDKTEKLIGLLLEYDGALRRALGEKR